MILRVPRCQEEFAGRPGQLVIVHKFIAIMSDFLIGPILAEFRDSTVNEAPAFFGFLKIKRGGLGKLLLECWRRSALGQRGSRRGGHGSGFGKNDLRITMIGRDIILVTAVPRVNQKIETAVGILHPGEKISLPFGFLEHVAFPVPAFGQAEIIEFGDARKNIGSKDQ